MELHEIMGVLTNLGEAVGDGKLEDVVDLTIADIPAEDYETIERLRDDYINLYNAHTRLKRRLIANNKKLGGLAKLLA